MLVNSRIASEKLFISYYTSLKNGPHILWVEMLIRFQAVKKVRYAWIPQCLPIVLHMAY
jgi:hypothetical protein